MAAVKTRRLKDLFVRGIEVEIDDGEGSLKLWVQKLNPIESEIAVRKANAPRAKFIMFKNDKESDQYLSIFNDVVDFERQDLIDFLATQDVSQKIEALESEFAEEKEWMKDDYLQGLHDAWDGGLEERFDAQEEPGDDIEAQKCHDELERFQEDFGKRISGETEAAALPYEKRPVEKLQEEVIDRMFKLQADLAWLLEYRKCEIWLGTRESKKNPVKLFDDRASVDEVATEVIATLTEHIQGLTVPVIEGKDSPATETSSQA